MTYRRSYALVLLLGILLTAGFAPARAALIWTSVDNTSFGDAFDSDSVVFAGYTKQGGSGFTSQVSLSPSLGATTFGQGQFNTSGSSQNFQFTYDPATGDVTYQVGSASGSTTAPTGGFNSIGIQLRADADTFRSDGSPNRTGLMISLTNILINGTEAAPDLLKSGGTPNIDSFILSPGLDSTFFDSPFTFEGDIEMSWATGTNFNSRISSSVYFANEAVPEPGSWALLAGGLTALLWIRRRRS